MKSHEIIKSTYFFIPLSIIMTFIFYNEENGIIMSIINGSIASLSVFLVPIFYKRIKTKK
jgi:hypothetical protein